MSLSRLQPHRATWLFVLMVLFFCHQQVTAADQFTTHIADGYFTIGPLDNEADLATVRSRLERSGIEHQTDTLAGKESLGFIVVTEPYPDKSAASPTLQQLSDAQVRDFLYVGRGDYANRISAGVFSNRDVAGQRAAGLNSQGFSFSVIERFRATGTVSHHVVVKEPGLSQQALVQILADTRLSNATQVELASPPAPNQTVTDIPPADQGGINDDSTARTFSAPSTAEPSVPEETGPVKETSDTVESISTSAEEHLQPAQTPGVDTSHRLTVSSSARQAANGDDSWLWYMFAGVAFILVGALTYYSLQQRSQAADSAPGAPDINNSPVPGPGPEEQPTASPPPVLTTTGPGTQQVIFDYAEAVLGGKDTEDSGKSLTILGTDDTSITDLIHDLLFLTRLEEGKEAIESFTFDSRSLVDNLITRLTAENAGRHTSLRSAPADDLPVSLALDANKLSRILTILLHHAIVRTESGLISIHQQFVNKQLSIEIHYHPDGSGIATELEVMTNPALSNSALTVGERVKFGVANRLTTVLGGKLDARIEAGEAIVRVQIPAIEIQAPQLSLPSGKSIDDLLNAETRAAEEVERTRREAEARVLEAVTRATDIEQNADRFIQKLKDEMTEISAVSAESARNLRESEEAIAELRKQLDQAIEERDTQLEAEQKEKADTLALLQGVNTELAQTRSELEKEIAARAASEETARTRVTDLESSLASTRATLEQESKVLRDKEDAAKAQVEALEASLTEMQSSKDAESRNALQSLREQIAAAESRLAEETENRTESEQSATRQIQDLLQQVIDAQAMADKLALEKQALDVRLETTVAELEQDRLRLESKIVRLEQDSQAALSDISRLESSLKDASESLENERAARAEAESRAAAAIGHLEEQLTAAQQGREEELAAQETRILEANDKIATLTQALLDAQTQLQEQLKEQFKEQFKEQPEIQPEIQPAEPLTVPTDQTGQADIDRLQQELSLAKTNLEAEISRRNIAESSAGTQINELIDELNQLRSRTNASIADNEKLEKEKQQHLEQIREELAAAQAILDQERNLHSGLKAESERARRDMQAKLAALEAEHSALKEKAERAEAFGQHQTGMLQEALSDAQSAQKLGDAARKVTQHLKSKIKRLETRVEAFEVGDQTDSAIDQPVPASTGPEANTRSLQKPASAPEAEALLLPQPPDETPDTSETNGTIEPAGDMDFSLDDFGDTDDTIEPDETFTPVHNDQPELRVEELFDKEPSAELDKEPTVELDKEPSAELDKQPSAEPDKQPSAAASQKSSAELAQEPPGVPGPQPLEEERSSIATEINTRAVFEIGPPTEALPRHQEPHQPLVKNDLADIEFEVEEPSAEPDKEPSAEPDKQPSAEPDKQPSAEPDKQPSAEPDKQPSAEPDKQPSEEEAQEYKFQFDDKPIRSSHPVNNPVLHAMIERFVERLIAHVDAMEVALASRDYLELVVSCNWVRGEANTLGFEMLVTPVDAIEQQLRKRKFSQIITHLSELRHMAERIETRHTASPDAPIQYFVPAHAKNAVIYENFVSQLGAKLLELEVAANAENTRQMTQLCRWIDRYGEKIRFLEVIEASNQLQAAINTRDKAQINRQLKAFIELYSKIEIIKQPRTG